MWNHSIKINVWGRPDFLSRRMTGKVGAPFFYKSRRSGKMCIDMTGIFLIIFFGILGAVFGSFFNCVINAEQRRTPTSRGVPTAPSGQSLNNAEVGYKLDFLFRRSVCPECGHKLNVLALIPIFSFVFLRGKCRSCRQKISLQYPIIEAVSAFLFVFVFWYHSIPNSQFPISNQIPISNYLILIKDLIFVSVLLLLFVFDLKYGIIPDRISIPAIIIAIIFGTISALSTVNSQGLMVKLFLAIFIGAGFFFLQHTISKGKWVGGGDIRLGALMGAMLSWPNVLIALFLAYVAGAVYGIIALILKKKTLKSAIPFGTFLTASTFVILFTRFLNI